MKTRRIFVSKDDVIRKAVDEYKASLHNQDGYSSICIDEPIPEIDFEKNIGYYNDIDLVKERSAKLDKELIATYDAQSVKNIVMQKFGLSSQQVYMEERNVDGQNITLLTIILWPSSFVSQTLIDDLSHFMDMCKYHPCVKSRHLNGLVILTFEPHQL